MSTRCQIVIIENLDVDEICNKWYLNTKKYCMIYKHSDGYPEHTGELLKSFAKAYPRMNDIEYMSANIIPYIMIDRNKQTIDNNDGFNDYNCLGYGISDCIHGDIAYLYIFDITNSVLYTINWWERKIIDTFNY